MLTELQQRLDGLYHDARRAGLADVQATAAALPDPRDLPAAFGAPTTAPAEGLRFIISDDPPFFTYALAWWLPVPFGYHALSAVEAARAIEAGAIPRGTAPALAALAFTGLEADGSLRRTPKWITPPRPRRSRRPRPAREPRTSRFARPPRPARRARPERAPRVARPSRPRRPPRPARPEREPRPLFRKTKKEAGVCRVSWDGCWVPGGCYPSSYILATFKTTWACKHAACHGPNSCVKGDCGGGASAQITGILSYLPKSWQAAPPPAPPPPSLAGAARRPNPRLRQLPGFAPGPSTPGLKWAPAKPRCPCGAYGFCWIAGCDCRKPGCDPYT
jgi:hypothetical protein